MKKIGLPLFTILFIVLVTVSCKKINTPTVDSKKLFGTWIYKYSSGGFSGGTTKVHPENTKFKFTEKGILYVYIDNKKFSKNKYTIELKKTITSTQLHQAIVYSDNSYQTFLFLDENNLLINDEFYDGYNHHFVRE